MDLNGLTQDEFQDLTKSLEEYAKTQGWTQEQGGQQEEQVQQVTFRLPDGRQITGSQEQVNAQVIEYYQQQQAGQQPQQDQQVKPSFSQEEFQRRLTNDGYEAAQAYYFENSWGYDPRQGIAQLAGLVKDLVGKVNGLETQGFRAQHQLSEEHWQAVQNMVKENGWQEAPQSYENALILARARGAIPAAEGQPGQGTQPMPSLPGATQQPGQETVIPQHFTGSGQPGERVSFDADQMNDLAVRQSLEAQADGMSTEDLRRLVDRELANMR
jgi:hypothetical protein